MANRRIRSSHVISIYKTDPGILMPTIQHKGNLIGQELGYQGVLNLGGGDDDPVKQLVAGNSGVELGLIFLGMK